MGLVEKKEGRLRLLSPLALQDVGIEEAFRMASEFVRDLSLCVEENSAHKYSIPHWHVKVEYDNLIIDKMPELRKWCLESGADFAKKIQQKLSNFDKDLNPRLASKVGGGRLSVGLFSYSEMPPLK